MKKMRRLLAALLVTTLLFGSNGFSYAAEAASEGTEETVQETVAVEEQESETTEETAPGETTVEDSSVQETVKSEESETDADLAEESAEAEESAQAEEAAEADDDTEASGTGETVTANETAAEEQAFTEGTLFFNGDEHDCDYSVTLTYDASAEIPEGAELSVREIEKDTEEYAAYLADADSAVANSVTDARFFDIKILVNGGEIQPKSPVRVSISYKETIEVEEKAQVEAVHFDEKKEEPVPVEVETNDETKVDEIAFEAESFSVYAVLYTVDVKFKDYAFSMPGEGSILLSELAQKLGFYSESETREFSVQDVGNVTFTSNDLVKTERQEEGDWLLTSLKAFSTEETLTIDMVNGDQFVVDVTDAQVDGRLTFYDVDGSTVDTSADVGSNYYIAVGSGNNIRGVAKVQPQAGVADLSFGDIDTSGCSYTLVKYTGSGDLTPEYASANWWYDPTGALNKASDFEAYSFDTSGGVTNFKAVKKDVYTVKINFYDRQVQNPVTPGQGDAAAITDRSWIKAEVRNEDGETVGFTFTPATTTGSSNGVILNSFKMNDGSTKTYAQIKEAGYELGGFRLAHADRDVQISSLDNYNARIADANDPLTEGDYDGYTFLSNQPDPGSDNSRTIRIRQADPTYYYVKVDCGDEKLTLPDNVDVYAKVIVTYASGQTGYGFVKLDSSKTSDDGMTYVAHVDKWFLGDQEMPRENISGHENNVTVELHAVAAGTSITRPTQLSSPIAVGSYVQGHKVESYPSIPKNYDPSKETGKTQRIIETVPNTSTNITDVVYLAPNKDKLSDTSIENLLTKYNVVTLCPNDENPDTQQWSDGNEWGDGDYMDGNHTIGGILVRGDLIGHASFTNIASGVAATSPSVVGGLLPNASFQIIGGGQAATKSQDFYVGDSNTIAGGYINGEQKNYNTYGKTVVNPDYVDWDQLQSFIIGQTEAMLASSTRTINVANGETVVVTAGEHVTLNYTGDGTGVRIIIARDPATTPDWDTAPGTVISISNSGTAKIPLLEMSDHPDGSQPYEPQSSTGDKENAGGLSAVFNFPNATEVSLGNSATEYGHVIAPKAFLTMDFQYNGCLIANAVKTSGQAEGHMWPYRGGKLVPSTVGLVVHKTVDGQEPTAEQVYTFKLDELKDGTWANIQTKQNNLGKITFDEILYAAEATHWYLLYEDEASVTSGEPDTTWYVLKVVVTADIVGEDTVYEQETTAYKVTDKENLLVDGAVNPKAITEVGEGETLGDTDNITFVNKENVAAQVKKEWVGSDDLPKPLTVTLYAGDEIAKINGAPVTVTLNAGNNWTSDIITGLPKKDANNNDIIYHWVEGDVPEGFFLTHIAHSDIVSEGKTIGILTTLTNTYQEFNLETSYVGTKTWQGTNKPESLTVELYRSIDPDAAEDKWIKLDNAPTWTGKDTNTWTYTFSNLPVFDGDGNVYYYKAKETLPEGYTSVSETYTATNYVQGTASYEKTTPCNSVEITLTESAVDLGFAVIMKGHEFIIWTHRIPSESEHEQIEAAAEDAYSSYKGHATYKTGIGTIVTDMGTITISEGQDGKLELVFSDTSTWSSLAYGHFEGSEYDTGTTAFINAEATGTAALKAAKAISGSTWPEGGQVTFTITRHGADTSAPLPDVTTTDALTEVGEKSFGDITFDAADVNKTYYYDITETATGFGSGWAGSPDKIIAKVEVGTADTDGKLNPTVSYSTDGGASYGSEASFRTITNTYTSVKAQPEVTKSISEWGSAESFTFTLAAKNPSDAPMPSGTGNVAVATEADTLAQFGEIEYTEPGTYIYTIKETDDHVPGITYDTAEHTATVKVSRNAETGELTAAVTYDDNKQDLTITNTFTKAEATLKATKSINDWGSAESFTFTLAPVEGAPMPGDAATVVKTVTKGGSLDAEFGTIEYDTVGKYKYTITETDDGVPGITYDTTPHEVVVNVHKAANSNDLVADVTYDGAANLIITNSYASTNLALQATKSISEWGDATSFTFKLAAGTSTVKGVEGTSPMPASDTATATKSNMTAVFGSVKYEEAGTYNYTITEVDDHVAGITYDTTPHNVVVTVQKNAEGNLVASAKYDGGDSLVITNTFTSLKKQLEATKSITEWGKATSFTFRLAAVTEGAPMPASNTATVTKGGSMTAVFGEIEYKTTGEYDYTITEQNDHVDGVTYDTTAHPVHVSVTKNETTNALEATITYGEGEEAGESLTITNTFTAAEAELEATKEFNDWGKATSFTFDLAAVSAVDTEDNVITPVPVPASMTATATEQAKTASFGKIKYDQAGTYTYTITEQNGGVDGVSYDTTPHTAVVTVSKDSDTNALTASVKYGDAESLTITNTYEATKATLEATKDFADWGKATEFTFDLAAVTAGAPMPASTTATATEENPLASFGEITFEKAGVYEYTITEQNGGADGVTYDTTAHPVTVTVVKAEDATNKLTATVKYGDASSLTITNTYASTKTELEATKQINDWGTADSFTFTLEAEGDAPMPADAEEGAKSVDVTKNNPLAQFGEIEYEKAGTYEYTITEEKGSADGVTYDTTAHRVVVTVAKDRTTNALSATVKYDGADALTITNKYASANVELQAKKQFSDWGKADSFTFTLEPVSKDAPMPAGTGEEGKKTATATETAPTANFGSITYKTAGTYEYTITETDDGKDGVTYDTTPHTVIVTVTKDANNKLVAEAKYDDKDSLIITNTYEAAKASLEATKGFEDWGKADSFTFDLEAVGDAPMPAGAAGGKKSGIATMNAPVVNFGEITYEKAGVYEYTITEQNGGADGVTYDTTPHNVVVTVTKGEGNKLSAEVKYDDEDSLTITNTYAATKATIEATKEFEDWGKATEFKFDLAAVTEGAPMPSKTTASATEENPLASFGEITYEKAGVYEYTITEQNGGADGVTYDTAAHKVKVTVTKADDATNKLTAAVTYDGAESLTITNTYEATKATLEATKDFADWGKATEFTFNLAAVTEGAPMPAQTSAKATEENPLASFGTITFEKAGTYEYTITEVNDGVDGVSYDTTAHKAVVTVSKAQGTNKLSASVSYDGKDSLIITNTFTAAEATLEATKSFNDWGKAESFTFDLAAVTEGAPMPEDTEAVATKENLNAVFGKVVYDKAGTYEYTITERNDGADGVTYDTTAHKVKVEVTKADDATNALSAKVTYDGDNTLIVTNTYASTSVTLQATKEFSDWGKAASFTFDLAAVTEGAPMPANKVATATESAKTAVFGSIEYEKTGKYEYTITERNDGVDGVTYDTKAHKVVVNVTKDADNKMTAKATYDGDEDLIITNTFTAAKAHFEVTKEFNDWGKADSFTFDLAAVTEGAPMPAQTSATATRGKAAAFGDMEFDKAGTYEYTITEQNGGADGVSYDVTPHKATVVVTKNAETNELSAEVNYDGEESLIVTNTFTAVKAHAEATKVLEGRDWFDADEFEFEIAAVTEGAPMPAEKTAKATKDAQTAIFGDMEYVKAGTYEYTITEKDGGIKGITYDTEPHSVTVTVSKAEDATNKLTAVVAYDGKDNLEITNKYEGSIVLKAKKALNGRPLEDKQFTFELYDENGQLLQAATNDVKGIVEFAPIGYTNKDIDTWDAQTGTGTGTKKYTVKEKIETKAGYTFDETELAITVTLTDNGDGTITAAAAPALEDLVLTNGYKAAGEIVLYAQKKFISANKLKEGQFTFELKNDKGDVIDTQTNAADGSVTFKALQYTQDDIYEIDPDTGVYSGAGTKTYTYTINEVIPEGAKDKGDGTFEYNGYTYDGTVYTVAVVLTDNGDGTISAVDAADAEKAEAGEAGTEEAAETESRYVFTNAYAAAGTLKLDAEKQFKNGTLKGGEFTFELKDADGNVMQSKTNDAAGNVSFDLIAYQLADVANAPFTYTVSEVSGSRTDVSYDETIYTVTVDLADNGDGTLKVTEKIDNGGKLKFVNEQRNVETSITISGVKVLKGKDLKAGQFKFVMADENGKKIDEVKNDADGNFTFGTITYKLSDLGGEKKKVFTYAISEVKGSDRSIIYDEKVHTVVVTVTDNGDGTMTATADKSGEDIKFVNTTRDKTGDEAPLGVLFGGLGFGAIGLAVLLEDRRRRNRSKE